MNNIKNCFKNRTVGFYIGFGSAVLVIITALAYVIAAAGDRTFSVLGFVLVIVGALTELVVLFTDLKFGPLIPVIVTSIGASIILVTCLPTLMDVVNGINFFGGNLAVAYAVPIVLAVAIIAACAACFMDMRK